MRSLNKAAAFTALTFAIMIFCWGLCIILAYWGFMSSTHPWIYVPFILGGLSPTIASYFVLKRNNEVAGFKEWMKIIFDFKAHIGVYLLVIFEIAVFFVSQYLILGFTKTLPFYMFFALLPVMLIGGGLEEAGWRCILQPEIDRKLGYVASSLLVAVIWTLWHLPLFYIPGAGQYGDSFLLFGISVLGLTFMLGAIRRVSGKVFPCVLVHCILNAGFAVFDTNHTQTLPGNLAVTGIVIAVSSAAVYLHKRQARQAKNHAV